VPEDASPREGFFGERAASVYDERVGEMFDTAAVQPVVELLAELPNTVERWSSGSARAGSPFRSPAAASRS
jgi:hypothetical protein